MANFPLSGTLMALLSRSVAMITCRPDCLEKAINASRSGWAGMSKFAVAVSDAELVTEHSAWSGLAGERPLFVIAWASRWSAALD